MDTTQAQKQPTNFTAVSFTVAERDVPSSRSNCRGNTSSHRAERTRWSGYAVVEMWECTFKKELKQYEELQDLVKNMTWVSYLDPRDAFYEGLTGMAKCYHTAEEGEQISYQDFTSLYPTINKYGTYPLGHPQIIVNPESQNIQDYFGIAKVDVLAPEKLLHPVLPVKLKLKLVHP